MSKTKTVTAMINMVTAPKKTKRTSRIVKRGFCVFIHTMCQGRIPAMSEGSSEDTASKWKVFDTELDAQLDIADFMQERLRQFIESKGEEREYHDAIEVEEYVEPVCVDAKGVVWDESGTISYGTGPT